MITGTFPKPNAIEAAGQRNRASSDDQLILNPQADLAGIRFAAKRTGLLVLFFVAARKENVTLASLSSNDNDLKY